ncbi:unnamed protein product [Calypogeia fissa]
MYRLVRLQLVWQPVDWPTGQGQGWALGQDQILLWALAGPVAQGTDVGRLVGTRAVSNSLPFRHLWNGQVVQHGALGQDQILRWGSGTGHGQGSPGLALGQDQTLYRTDTFGVWNGEVG